MTTTIGISFSEQRCDAVMLTQKKSCFTYHNPQSIQHAFENFFALPALLKTIQSIYPKNSRVIVGIPSQHSMTRDFTFDVPLSDAAILQFLKSRALQLFGHESEQLCLDYEIHPDNNTHKQTINVVAAHRTMIHKIQNAFATAKMNPHAIDVDTHAIERANKHMPSSDFLSLPEMRVYAAAVGLCLWGII